MGRLHCECKRPEISGHPCAHIFAVGLKGGKDPYKYMNTADTMHGYRKQYCDAVRLSPPETGAAEDASACSEWQSFAGIDIFGVAGGTPTGCDGHGLQMFRDIATDKLELKVREYPVAPSMTRLLEMHSPARVSSRTCSRCRPLCANRVVAHPPRNGSWACSSAAVPLASGKRRPAPTASRGATGATSAPTWHALRCNIRRIRRCIQRWPCRRSAHRVPPGAPPARFECALGYDVATRGGRPSTGHAVAIRKTWVRRPTSTEPRAAIIRMSVATRGGRPSTGHAVAIRMTWVRRPTSTGHRLQ